MFTRIPHAQGTFTLLLLDKNNLKDLQPAISYKTAFSDTLQRNNEIFKVISRLRNDGFIAASCDSLHYDSLMLTGFISVGSKFKYVIINNDEDLLALYTGKLKKRKTFKREYYDIFDFLKVSEEIITYYENKGYPFVNIRLDSIVIKDSLIRTSILINKNNFYIIDSVVVRGSASGSSAFIMNYMGIKPNSIYQESGIQKISRKINEIDFFTEVKPLAIEFYDNKAKIILFLNKARPNQFDGIVGFMPDELNKKLIITGDVKLMLSNSFNRGEVFLFKWNKYDQLSQNLKFSFNYPYIFYTPFGMDVEYSLYKRDTSYINNKGNLGFKYIFDGNNHLKAFYEKQLSSVLTENIQDITTGIPFINSTEINLYGMELKKQKLNHPYNPRNGFFLKLSASAGNKEIIKNNAVHDSIYKHIELRSSQFVIDHELLFFIPLFTRSCVFIGSKSALISNDYLFDNEVYRIGGLKTLRGFDEESIPASVYSILTLEYRFLFEEYSYLSIFWNGCYYEKKTVTKYAHGIPFGFGAGVNVRTKLGVFSLNYALGKFEYETLYFKRAKIHFGITNYF